VSHRVAGPAGLAAALDLTLRGVGVVIIDESAGVAAASRAKGIQPRTLEILESLGVVDEVVTGGAAFPRWRTYSAGQVAWEKSIYDLLGIGEPAVDPAVPFPQTWMVPQWHTERVLRDALSDRGVHVESRSSLTVLDIADAALSATVTGPGSRVTTSDT
jgi:2-polyprenyl-6-methoxyphenol hydroxylase-like FAD-dependent oxidoreductase